MDLKITNEPVRIVRDGVVLLDLPASECGEIIIDVPGVDEADWLAAKLAGYNKTEGQCPD